MVVMGIPILNVELVIDKDVGWVIYNRSMEAQPLHAAHIAEALTAIHSPGATPTQIKTASDFLDHSETHPFFSTTLLSVYAEAVHPQLQMSSLLLLTNVLKRNWNSKRASALRPAIRAEVKEEVRAGVLRAYPLHQMRHYKHFNSLLAYLARMDFPVAYPGLHEFVGEWIRQLGEAARGGLEGLLRSDRVLVVLSTVKVVLKEYNLKKFSHNPEVFVKFIAPLIQTAASLSQALLPEVKRLVAEGAAEASRGLECLRKVDKVVLYCLGSMPVIYQYQPETQALVQAYVGRVQQFSGMLQGLLGKGGDSGVWQQGEKYLIGILEQVGRLQNYFPFAFAPFLREYLVMLLRLLVQNVPRPYFYQSDKLLSVIVTANIKPLTCFAYYMSQGEFRGSVYCRQKTQFDNVAMQAHCHSVFREVYSPETVVQLVRTIVCEIMTAGHILRDHREFSDELVLEDVEVAVVEQVADPSVYQNCVSLLKQTVKCFKQETRPVVGALIDSAREVRVGVGSDSRSRQVFLNILEVVLFLPHVYSEEALPIDQVCGVINAVYESALYGHLSRLIRKYYSHLPSQTARSCFELLAKVVATPAGGAITPQVIYQSALGLKTLMGGLESDNIPVEVVAGCISNIVTLVGLPEVVACPTLMWPIINLLIRLVKNLHDIDRQLVGEAAALIVRGLAPLIASERNEELLVNALVELLATLFYCCFKPLKQQCLIRGRPGALSEKVQATNGGVVLFEGGVILMRMNMHNRALENNCNLQCFWLSLLRSYPSLYEQQAYRFDLARTNAQLLSYFQEESKALLEDDPVVFLQLLDEYFITELVDVSPQQLMEVISGCMGGEETGSQRRLRVAMAAVSLYTSYSILRTPLLPLTELFFRELLDLQNRISPQVNALRTAIFLLLGQRMLVQDAGEVFRCFTEWTGGEVGRWLLPYLWNMHFVTNKFAFKLNAAVLLKAMADLGPPAFAQLMKTNYQNQFAIDEFLKIITIQLEPLNLDFLLNSYHNITRTLLPNEIVPDFEVPVYRKVRLQLGDPLLTNVATIDLKEQLRKQLGAVMVALDWSSADLDQRMGETAALKFCEYLGWERAIQ